MAALRSLTTDRPPDLPFRRRQFTLSLLALVAGMLVGVCVIAYLVARVIG